MFLFLLPPISSINWCHLKLKQLRKEFDMNFKNFITLLAEEMYLFFKMFSCRIHQVKTNTTNFFWDCYKAYEIWFQNLFTFELCKIIRCFSNIKILATKVLISLYRLYLSSIWRFYSNSSVTQAAYHLTRVSLQQCASLLPYQYWRNTCYTSIDVTYCVLH